jgi:hypothetical protein
MFFFGQVGYGNEKLKMFFSGKEILISSFCTCREHDKKKIALQKLRGDVSVWLLFRCTGTRFAWRFHNGIKEFDMKDTAHTFGVAILRR